MKDDNNVSCDLKKREAFLVQKRTLHHKIFTNMQYNVTLV